MSGKPDLAPDVRAILDAIRRDFVVKSIPERTLTPGGLSGPPGVSQRLFGRLLDALMICIKHELAYQPRRTVPIQTAAEWAAYRQAAAQVGQVAAGELAAAILARRLTLEDVRAFLTYS
ncbi:MAG TPA: hypothetical protein VLI05_01185 [Candidatus Saccharimonadia bacterium]|nr:hypothetical protein [Candidatus Saccharimonadia bacterium]